MKGQFTTGLVFMVLLAAGLVVITHVATKRLMKMEQEPVVEVGCPPAPARMPPLDPKPPKKEFVTFKEWSDQYK